MQVRATSLCRIRTLALPAAAVCAAVLHAQSLYPQRASAPVGVAGFALADCDLDGLQDLLTAPGASAPLVLRGDGQQGFEPWWTLSMANPGQQLVVADWDADGWLDVAAAQSTSGAALFRGLGPGGFQAAGATGFTVGPDAIASADLDGDAKLDLAWLGSSSMLGVSRGDGAFGFAISSTVAVPDSGALRCLDLDGDGRPELVHATRPTFHTGELVSRSVDAQGQIAPQQVLHAAATLYVWQAGDLDADGDLDLVLQEEPSLAITVLGNGSGGFTPASAPFTTRRARDFAIADVNLDGRADLLAAADGATASDPALEWWIGLGGLVLGPQLVAPELPKLSALEVTDLEGDGQPDIVLGHTGAGARATVIRMQAGALGVPVRIPLADPPLAIERGDWNRDGHADLAAITAQELVLALGNGQGGVGSTAAPLGANSGGGLVAGDWNLDGDPDFACGTSAGVLVLHGDGSGGYASAGTSSLGFEPNWLGAADFDQDGRTDLAAARAATTSLAVLPGTTGGFSAPLAPALSVSIGAVALGRAGTDAYPDIVVSPTTSAALRVLAGGPGFAFPQQSISKPGFQKEVTLADLDLDGDDDLVLAGSSATAWSLQSAQGSFGAWSTSSSALTSSVAAGDVDGDGRVDLVGQHDGLGLLRVLLGVSGSGFALGHEHVGPGSTRGLVLTDQDADGRLEVVCGDSARRELWLYSNARADAVGASAFGVGTSGCLGRGGIGASGDLKPGGSVRMVTSGAPPQGQGWGVVAVAPLPGGADPFGLGVTLHVDLLAGPAFLFGLRADAAGVATRWFPIPQDPLLTGVAVPLQVLWPWDSTSSCDPSAFGLASSRGLSISIGP